MPRGNRVSAGLHRRRAGRAPRHDDGEEWLRAVSACALARAERPLPMKVTATAIPDVMRLCPRVFTDDRGYFFESFNAKTLAESGIRATFVQDNHSQSRRGVLRGL